MKHIFMKNQQNSKRIHQIKEKLKLLNIQNKILLTNLMKKYDEDKKIREGKPTAGFNRSIKQITKFIMHLGTKTKTEI